MEHILDLLKMAFCIVIFVGILTVIATLTNKGRNLFNDKTSDIEEIIHTANNISFSRYDKTDVTSSAIYDLVNNYQNAIEVRVQTYAMQKAGTVPGRICKDYYNPDGSEITLGENIQKYYIFPNSPDKILDSGNGFIFMDGNLSSSDTSTSHKLTVSQYHSISDSSSPFYINPDGRWHSEIQKQGADIVGILFTQVKPDNVT